MPPVFVLTTLDGNMESIRVFFFFIEETEKNSANLPRDRGGGGAVRAAAPPLFCAPAPIFCAKKKNN